jgi:hypothetical protein
MTLTIINVDYPAERGEAAAPCAGIRVLDLTRVIAGAVFAGLCRG